jgi:hypothetical protein
MPPEDEKAKDDTPSSSSSSSFKRQADRAWELFSIPGPVKRLFDKVPVLTYAPNELPQRTPRPTRLPTLYVFIKEEDAAAGRPSFNPSCLKWQVSYAQMASVKESLTISRPFSRSLRYNTGSSPRIIMLHPRESCLSSYRQFILRKACRSRLFPCPPTSSSSSH